jgi:signal transduction histidine kinase
LARTDFGRGLHLFWFRRREIRVHERLQAELAERERIARNAQQTLLQGVQGVMVGFQTAAAAFPKGDPTRQLIESALDRAERDLLEGRRRMALLRDSRHAGRDLPELLHEFGEELSSHCATIFDSAIEGTPRALTPAVREGFYRIGTEALSNAFHRSKAQRVTAVLSYRWGRFSLRVSDNGVGFDRRRGMDVIRASADRINACVRAAGATVEVEVPARAAYRSCAFWGRGEA